MHFSWISTYLIALWVISSATDSCQELLLIRGPAFRYGTDTRRKLTCLAEDDGSALILNVDLGLLAKSTNTPITTPCYTTSAMSHNCINLTIPGVTDNWEVTDSVKHPMGPVFDYRWEGFNEYAFEKGTESISLYSDDFNQQGTVIFSARGLGAITVKLCSLWRMIEYCSNITIPARPSETSEMSTISNSPKNWQESKANTELNQPFISEYDWQTFILKWGNNKMKIQAHGSNMSIKNETTVNLDTVNRIYIASTHQGRVRWHKYNYLLTTRKHTKLYSEIWSHNEQNLCIELLVSLCSKCELILDIVNSQGDHITTIGNISGEEKPASEKLPAWRLEKRHANVPHDYLTSYMKLEIFTQLRKNATRAMKGRWAIGHWRKCPSIGAVRMSSSYTIKKWIGSTYDFPVAKCQKLSSTNTLEVRTDAANDHNISSSLQKCLHDGESASCRYQQSFGKSGTSFCERDGCICTPGFTGSDCEKECSAGFYGYDCRESCNHCEDKACEKTTGFCYGDCLDYYLPPFCKTKLEPPAVSDVGGSTAVLRLNYSIELNVDEIRDLHFQLKTGQEDWTIPEIKSQNMSIFEATICGLAPGTRYRVRAVMLAKTAYKFWAYFESPEKDFVTTGSAQAADPDPAAWSTGSCDKDSNYPGLSPNSSCGQDEAPRAPTNLRVISQGKGVVTLKWYHTGHTCTHIDRFVVKAIVVESKLQMDSLRGSQQLENYLLSQNQLKYTSDMKLHLLPSTLYNFAITAINTYGNSKPAIASFQIPASVGFTSGQVPAVSRNGSFIELRVPAVENATRNSRIKVVVKGLPVLPCSTFETISENFKKLLNMTESEKAWIATEFNVTENSPVSLTIGIDLINNNSGSCALRPDENYMVVVVLEDDQKLTIFTCSPIYAIDDEKSPNLHLIWLVVFPVLIICLLLLYDSQRNGESIFTRIKASSVHDVINMPRLLIHTHDDEPLDCCPHLMKLKEFEDYVNRAAENGVLETQFKTLRRGLLRPCDRGNLLENRPKNRCRNLIAYDDTRVVLEGDLSDPHADYINANYIEGYDKENAYIATQGPKSNTVVDFWRMIWQEDVRIVCMLVNVIENGQKMCEQYWPEVEKEIEYGHLTIRNVEQRIYAHHTHRTFQLTSSRESGSRKVTHLHYTDWPEQGVPIYSHSIVEYLNELRAITAGPGPIVVHCTSGVGRTGTIILCDICLRYTAAEGKVDVFAEARKMYNARANMLDNLQQYVLAHLMPTQCFLFESTKILCSKVSPEIIDRLKKDLPVHMQRLELSAWKDKALRPLEPLKPPLTDHIAKNRFPKFTPGGPSLVTLERYPTHDTNSDYISAVSVDGVKTKRQYLASQLPLPETLSDFWRLVAEKRVELIVVLQRPSPEDPSCSDVIPPEGTTFAPVPYITVKTKSASDSNEYYTTDKLLLIDTSKPEARWQDITVLTCNNWGLAEGAEPPSPKVLVKLWSASERVPRARGYTLVLCHDGLTGCGLYLALSCLLERMIVDRECDVILAVRAVRQSRPQFVNSKEQFEYLYDAALNLVQSFETYSNFT